MRAQSLPVPSNEQRRVQPIRQPSNSRPIRHFHAAPTVQFASTIRYAALLQRKDHWDEQFTLSPEIMLQNLKSKRTMRFRDAVDSLKLSAMKSNVAKGQYFVFVDHSKLYELHGLQFVTRLAQVELLDIIRPLLDVATTQFNAATDAELLKTLMAEVEELTWVEKKVETNSFMDATLKSCLSLENPHKLNLLNSHPTCFATKDGMLFDSVTQRSRVRTEDDYFAEELQVNYMPTLRAEDNLFHQFRVSQYLRAEELEWQLLHDGYLISSTNHEESFDHKWSSMGGNGKDVEVSALRAAFGDAYICELPKEVVLLGVHCNYGAELQRLRNTRIAYIVELNEENVDLEAIKKLSSHGMLDIRDCREAGKVIAPFHSTHSLLGFGNALPTKFLTDNALQRRFINHAMKVYFRAPNSTGWDASDRCCKPINQLLVVQLKERIDHVFTYYMNALLAYYTAFASDPSYSTKNTCPESIKVIPRSPYQTFADEHLVFEIGVKIEREELYAHFNQQSREPLTNKTKPVLMNMLLMSGAIYKVCRFSKTRTAWAFAGVRFASSEN